MEWILLMEGQASSTHWLLHQTWQDKSIFLNNSLKRNSIPKMTLISSLLWYPFLAMIMPPIIWIHKCFLVQEFEAMLRRYNKQIQVWGRRERGEEIQCMHGSEVGILLGFGWPYTSRLGCKFLRARIFYRKPLSDRVVGNF